MIVDGQYYDSMDDYYEAIGWHWENGQLLNQHGEVVGKLVERQPAASAYEEIQRKLKAFGLESPPSRPLVVYKMKLDPVQPGSGVPRFIPEDIQVLLPDGQFFGCQNLGDAMAIKQEWI